MKHRGMKHRVRNGVGPVLTTTVLLAALTGCTMSGGSTPYSTPSATPSAMSTGPTSTPGQTGSAPTADQVTWAGNVCSDTTALQTQVQGLASAAATGGTEVVAAISDQMQQISASTGELIDTVKSAPSGTSDDQGYSDVKSATEKLDTSLKTLQDSAGTVQGASGAALITALGTVVADTGTMLTDVASTVTAITTAMKDASSTLGQAFQAAPDCAPLTAT